jgi:hypothetical protein
MGEQTSALRRFQLETPSHRRVVEKKSTKTNVLRSVAFLGSFSLASSSAAKTAK